MRLFYLALSFLLLLVDEASAHPPGNVPVFDTKGVFFHKSCESRVQDAYDDAIEIYRLIRDTYSLADDTMQKQVNELTEWLHINDDSFLSDIRRDASILIDDGRAANQASARVVFYCDNDARWTKDAKNDIIPGNEERDDDSKAWYDSDNAIAINLKGTSKSMEKPPCQAGNILGITYFGSLWHPSGKKCVITLCNIRLTDHSKTTLSSMESKDFSQLKDVGMNFAWGIISATIVHELAHTLFTQNSDYKGYTPGDVGGYDQTYRDWGYHWGNVKDLDDFDAQSNAETVMFYGVGLWLINKGFSISEDGSISLI